MSAAQDAYDQAYLHFQAAVRELLAVTDEADVRSLVAVACRAVRETS